MWRLRLPLNAAALPADLDYMTKFETNEVTLDKTSATRTKAN